MNFKILCIKFKGFFKNCVVELASTHFSQLSLNSLNLVCEINSNSTSKVVSIFVCPSPTHVQCKHQCTDSTCGDYITVIE